MFIVTIIAQAEVLLDTWSQLAAARSNKTDFDNRHL